MTKQFTHLHVHTEYSLLDGASKIKELVAYAKELGMESLAITDHGVMYGVVDFYQECEKQGIKPIIGCEVYVAPASHLDRNTKTRFHLILLAENNKGYHNLMKLVSTAQLEGMYYKPRVDKDLLRKYHEGIICLSACIAGEVPVYLRGDDLAGARRAIEEYIDIFGKDHYYFEIQNHALEEEAKVTKYLKQLSKEYDIPLVATNDLHYVHKADADAQDILLCLQTQSTVDDPDRMRFPNNSFYLKSYEEMLEVFPDCQEALENTNRVAERCNVTLEFGKLLLPAFPVPEGFTEETYLRKLCEEALPSHYPELTQAVRNRLEYELGIIHQMGYDAYFLIVWDFINYSREHDIPVGPGRGSAAGSVVAFLLGITNIEPMRYNLLFERFLNPERVSMPDIDTDFCYEKRDEVLKYVIRRYGKDRVAQIVTFGTLAARAAVRDVGRALAMPYAEVNKVVTLIPKTLGITLNKALDQSKDFRELYDNDPQVKKLVDFARAVEGLPRNCGTHAAGVIIAPQDLRDFVPLQQGMDERSIITQYDKNKVEELGLLKMDFLGLRTLTVINDAIKFIQETTGEKVDIDHLPLKDPATTALLRRGDTFGVFQLESAGITKLLVELEPDGFEHLIPLVALYRPGPLGSGMAEDFIAGRHGRQTATVLHPLMEPILADTFGVILYQEQVMQITSALAGFSLGQADILRRAMGKKKASVLAGMKQTFVDGAKKLHNIPEELSERVFALLQNFADYGFNKSHSVAYALVAYQTAYLKAHYPSQFMAAFLNSVITDGDKLSFYITQCRNAGLKILPPDVNASGTVFNVDKDANIRFGLAGIKGAGKEAVKEIISKRQQGGAFKDLVDFCNRVSMRIINRRLMENLIRSGAMDSFGAKRAQLLAICDACIEQGAAYQRDQASGQLSLFGDLPDAQSYTAIKLPDIEELSKEIILQDERALVGFYITGHPLDKYREQLKAYIPLYQCIRAAKEEGEDVLQDGHMVRIAGIISSCVLKTTRQGDSYAQLVLEDFTGRFPVIVFPKTYKNYLKYLVEDNIIALEGRFSIDERDSKIIAMQLGTIGELFGRQPYQQHHQTRVVQEAPVEPEGKITIRVRKELENSKTQKGLLELFKKYSGKTMIIMRLEGSRQMVKTDPRFWVDGNAPGFRPELENILGSGCII